MSTQLPRYSIPSSARLSSPSDAQRLGRLHVNDQFDLRGLHHGQVGGLLALEDAAGIHAGLAQRIPQACPVAHQAALQWKIAQGENRRKSMARRECDEQLPSALREQIRAPSRPPMRCCTNRMTARSISRSTNGSTDDQFTPERIRGGLHVLPDGFGVRIGWIFERADGCCLGHRLVQHSTRAVAP
jgi:hypothetical protein